MWLHSSLHAKALLDRLTGAGVMRERASPQFGELTEGLHGPLGRQRALAGNAGADCPARAVRTVYRISHGAMATVKGKPHRTLCSFCYRREV